MSVKKTLGIKAYNIMMGHLTRKKIPQTAIKTADEVKQPPVKEEISDREAFNAFMKRNPQADGGRIGFLSGGDVERIVDIYNAGLEGGYRTSANFIAEQLGKKPGEVSTDIVGRKINELIKDGTLTKQKELKTTKTKGKRKIYKVARPIETRDRINNPDIPKDAKFKMQVPGGKFRDKSSSTTMIYDTTKEKLNERLKKIEGDVYVKPSKPKEPIPDDKFLVVKKRGPTVDSIKKITYEEVLGKKNQPNTFKPTGKIVTKYKPLVGPDKVTIPGLGADNLKEAQKFVKDYFKKNPKQIRVRDPKKDYASKDVREKALKETDPTKAKGTKKFNYHHIRQIAGGVPLTTDDVMIINQRINSALGTKYNKPLNAISAAIQKNNKLALEAMNAKNEGAALDYMKRVDELNESAEKIVNSAIDKLPKKYKGYVGFNQFTLPRDEYGLPISNEPMIIRKVGGMPVSKDAIDLTTLNLKQEKEFKKIVKAQAEKGKVGKIDASKIGKEGFIDFGDARMYANPFFSPGVLKEAFKTIPTPLGAVGLTAGFGVDPTSAIDRASIAAEAAFAPQLVKQSAKMGAAQRLFNLGLTPAMAARVARIASPLGIASLGAEGLYQAGKFTKKRIGELKAMTPEQRQNLRAQQEALAFEGARDGGLIGDKSGPAPESGPQPQGLPGIYKRVKKQ